MIHFNAKLWNIHQLCVLHILNDKEAILARKAEKFAKAEMLRHSFRLSSHNLNRTRRSYVVTSNKDQVELKSETKIVTTSHNSVATLIKANGSGILS